MGARNLTRPGFQQITRTPRRATTLAHEVQLAGGDRPSVELSRRQRRCAPVSRVVAFPSTTSLYKRVTGGLRVEGRKGPQGASSSDQDRNSAGRSPRGRNTYSVALGKGTWKVRKDERMELKLHRPFDLSSVSTAPQRALLVVCMPEAKISLTNCIGSRDWTRPGGGGAVRHMPARFKPRQLRKRQLVSLFLFPTISMDHGPALSCGLVH